MKINCEHCEEVIRGRSYRVFSYDDDGSILLDMVVCEQCNDRARSLGLKAEELRSAVRRSRTPVGAPTFAHGMSL